MDFIFREGETGNVDGKEVITSKVNIQLPNTFGYLCGIKIEDLITRTYLEVYPQKKVSFYSFEKNVLNPIDYHLDFGLFKYSTNDPNTILKKYCIECDVFESYETKEQLEKDNKRMRNLLLEKGYATCRYQSTEIMNLEDSDIGSLLSNL